MNPLRNISNRAFLRGSICAKVIRLFLGRRLSSTLHRPETYSILTTPSSSAFSSLFFVCFSLRFSALSLNEHSQHDRDRETELFFIALWTLKTCRIVYCSLLDFSEFATKTSNNTFVHIVKSNYGITRIYFFVQWRNQNYEASMHQVYISVLNYRVLLLLFIFDSFLWIT